MTTIPISAVRQKENLWPILRLGDYRLATSSKEFALIATASGIAANDDSYTRKLNDSQVLEVVIRFSMIGIRSQRSMKIVASCGTMGKPLASKPETTQWCRSSSP